MSTSAPARFCAALGLGLVLTLATPAISALADPPESRGPCAYDPASLPSTPDAVEGWIGNCLERAGI